MKVMVDGEYKRARTLRQRAHVLAVAAGLTAAACASAPERAPAPISPAVEATAPAATIDAPASDAATPAHLQAESARLVRVALLLPFSSNNAGARAEAASMLDAAQLALFERGHERMVLIPKDTAGTPEGAASAARSALGEGADVILGPLFATGVEPVVAAAAPYGAPVIAFSNDRSAAGQGAYLLNITPESEIARLVEFATRQGVQNFYAFVPANAYGYRVRDALDIEARRAGAVLASYEVFSPGADADLMTEPARRLAETINASVSASVSYEIDPFGQPRYTRDSFSSGTLVEAGSAVSATHAVLLPEGGVRLLALAPLLPYYDVDPRIVRFMGTSQWSDESVAREPTLNGGWFVAPSAEAGEEFTFDFENAFGAEPRRLSGFAYDAVSLVAHLTRRGGADALTAEALENPDGFFGADGLFRFREDGASEWGLAMFAVRGGEFQTIEPAPDTFRPSGF